MSYTPGPLPEPAAFGDPAFAPSAALFSADQLRAHTAAEVARAVAAERERCAKVVRLCLSALAEELGAWDIDPPIHHVKEAHDACAEWLADGLQATP